MGQIVLKSYHYPWVGRQLSHPLPSPTWARDTCQPCSPAPSCIGGTPSVIWWAPFRNSLNKNQICRGRWVCTKTHERNWPWICVETHSCNWLLDPIRQRPVTQDHGLVVGVEIPEKKRQEEDKKKKKIKGGGGEGRRERC